MKRICLLIYLLFCVTLSSKASILTELLQRVITKLPSTTESTLVDTLGKTGLSTVDGILHNPVDVLSDTTFQPLLLSSPLNEIELPALISPEEANALSTWEIYQTLTNLVDQTYEQALLEEENYPLGTASVDGPVTFKTKIPSISPVRKEAYPDQPFLHRPLLGPLIREAYMLAQSNRWYIYHLREMETFWPRFNEAIPRFYQEAEATVQPAETELVSWALKQIPLNTKVLGVGEYHGYMEISEFVAKLLEALVKRAEAHNQKVVMFTEFRSNYDSEDNYIGLISGWTPYWYYHVPIWEKAQNLGVEVIGLEDKYIKSSMTDVKKIKNGHTHDFSLWATMEGLRLRNKRWLEIIQAYQKENPNDILFIYAGADHLLLNKPFTLSKQFNPEEIFVLSVIPDRAYNPGFSSYHTNELERLNPNLFFPQSAIKWQSPDLIELSGYMACVRLPIDIEAKKNDIRRYWETFGPQLWESHFPPGM